MPAIFNSVTSAKILSKFSSCTQSATQGVWNLRPKYAGCLVLSQSIIINNNSMIKLMILPVFMFCLFTALCYLEYPTALYITTCGTAGTLSSIRKSGKSISCEVCTLTGLKSNLGGSLVV